MMPNIGGRNKKGRYQHRKPTGANNKTVGMNQKMLRYVIRKKRLEQQQETEAANEHAVIEAGNATAEILLHTASVCYCPNDDSSTAQPSKTRPGDEISTHQQIKELHRTPNKTIKERGTENVTKRQLDIKTKDSFDSVSKKMLQSVKDTQRIVKSTPADKAVTLGRQRFKRKAQKEMLQQTRKLGRTTTDLIKRVAAAIIDTPKSSTAMLVGSLGSVSLVVILGVVILVGAIASSPFGILFANEPTNNATPLSSAISQINMELSNHLYIIQTGEYDGIIIQGSPPDWIDVVAVFACRTTSGTNGIDVASLDPSRVNLLRGVFWDMCTIASEIETIESAETNTSNSARSTEEKQILYITITAKTAEEMRGIYAFTEAQNKLLDALLANRAMLNDLIGNLGISQKDAYALLASLPIDLSAERREVVRHALSLVGKVNYFWGGKSLVIGWDDRWGQLREVTSAGSPTTGTYRPYGLDCSGFVDWVFYNASNGQYILGHGGGAASQHTYCTSITWEEALPGDLVFYSGDTHVGIVGGWDQNGNILVIHCASGQNNVVITGTSGFASVARPRYYSE